MKFQAARMRRPGIAARRNFHLTNHGDPLGRRLRWAGRSNALRRAKQPLSRVDRRPLARAAPSHRTRHQRFGFTTSAPVTPPPGCVEEGGSLAGNDVSNSSERTRSCSRLEGGSCFSLGSCVRLVIAPPNGKPARIIRSGPLNAERSEGRKVPKTSSQGAAPNGGPDLKRGPK